MKQTKEADLILTHGYVITVDQDRRIIRDGAIAIKDGLIAGIGQTSEILAHFKGEQFDCKQGVVHPGLIDAHEHLSLHITRGWEPDTFSVLDTWLNFERLAFPAVTAVEEMASVEIATIEMLKNGTTLFADTGSTFNPAAVIGPASAAGIRGLMGKTTGDVFNEELTFLSGDRDELLAFMEDNLKRHASGLVQASPQVCGMGNASDELVVRAKELANKYGRVLFMHQCVYLDEVQQYREKYGHGPIRHLAKLGVLDANTTLVHMIHLDEGDIDILLDAGVNVVHCPGASIKFGLGAFSCGHFPDMHRAGINIALGTDSGTWSDALDMLLQTYLAATIHREVHREQLSINAYTAFEMATIGGAKAVGLGDKLGSLETGKWADIVIHNTRHPESKPMVDPFVNLIYGAKSKSVDSVLVGGSFSLLHGRTVHVDEAAVYARAEQVAHDFQRRIGYTVHSPWPIV